MTELLPQTLLQLAGAEPYVLAWDDAVLVLVDHQDEYLSGALPLVGVREAVAEMAALLERARAAGAPVVHVVHHGRPGAALFDPDGAQIGIIAGLSPRAHETVVVKRLPNAFAGTGLDDLLRKTGRSSLVVAGFATHMCISATVRAALDHGYRTVVVADACATRDLPGALGGVIPARQVHEATLAALGDRFATVVRDVHVFDK
jgi:nicotinamidase-related amidase